jgi:DUF2075 family protein
MSEISEYSENKQQEQEQDIEYQTDPITGDTIYQDPQTKAEYILDKATNSWKPKSQEPASNTDYGFDGKTYLHTDDNGIKHKWDLETKQWVKLE